MIDVSVLFGASPRDGVPDGYDLASARAELARHGVSAALVCSRAGAVYRHEVGNQLTFEAAAQGGPTRLLPVATVNPVQYLEWRAEVARALAAGAVAFRFFPDLQHWDVDDQAFQEMLPTLRRPLLVPVSRFGDASRIGAVTERLDQPVILLGGHYSQLGDCLAALRRWPHLYLETSRLGQFRGVETVVGAVGAERLLFGSGCPRGPIQAPLNAVLTADVSATAKQQILAGNAARLFGLSLNAFELPVPACGQNLVDVHTHVGKLPFPTPPLDDLAHYGIETAIASSIRAIMDDLQVGNAEALATAGVLPYVVVNPNDLDGSCHALTTSYAAGAVGAKLHCQWSGRPTASAACRDLLQHVARLERPLKIHVDGPAWDQALIDVARAHPRWRVILAHAGPGTPVLDAANLVSCTDNVYVELATTAPDLPVVREVVRRISPDRLLFGSDAPLIDPAYVQGIYADAGADLSRTPSVAREVFDL